MQSRQDSYLFIPAVMAALTLLLYSAAAISIYLFLSPGDLAPPTKTLIPSTQDLAIFQEAGDTSRPVLVKRNAQVPWKEIENFHKHLEIAALQQGWMAYPCPEPSCPAATDANIIMPVEELPSLQSLEADPIGWVTSRTAAPRKAQRPSSTNLIKVRLEVKSTNVLPSAAWIITALLSGMIGCFLLLLTAGYCKEVWNSRHIPE